MKRKAEKKIMHKKCDNANRASSVHNFPPIPIESTKCDTELKIIDFIDLSNVDNSFDEKEKEKEQNKNKNDNVFELNKLLIGKKRERSNNKDDIKEKEKEKQKEKEKINQIEIEDNTANNTNNIENYPFLNFINENNINNKGKTISEKQELINLVNEEGFNKVFNLMTNTYFDRRNYIERKLDDIICNIGLLRTSLIMFQIKLSQPEIQNGESAPISPPPKPVEKITKTSPENQIINNEEYELGEHFHKDKNGNIYKYNKHHFRVKNRISFNCADIKCKSRGLYFVNNMKFRVMTCHSIPYKEHCYIKNKEKFNRHKAIFDDFKKKNCHEGQVFKNDLGDKLVKWYDN